MYFFVLAVLKGGFRLRLISVIDSLVLAWRGRPGFQVTKFQQVVSSGGSRGGTRGGAAPPLFLDQTEALRAEKYFWRPGPSPLSKREWSTSFSLALSQDLNDRAPTYFKVWIRHWSVSPVRDSWSTPVVRKLESAIHRINSLSSGQTNRPLPSNKNTHFQNKAKCTTFLVKMSFICTEPRFDSEARENSEKAHCVIQWVVLSNFWTAGPGD